MKYIEDSTQELKREITNVIKKEIVAFLNTFGGTIFVGVNDDGSIYWNLTEKQKDIEQTKIINWIIGGVFSPDCKEFIDLQWNSDGVLEIHVAQGDQKPYYLTEKGCNSKGCFLRFETSKMPASKADIKRMKLQSQEIYFLLIANNLRNYSNKQPNKLQLLLASQVKSNISAFQLRFLFNLNIIFRQIGNKPVRKVKCKI